MQKTRRSIFTAAITALFVLSVCYFALLAPTTAWYYQEDALSYNYGFAFKNFEDTMSPTTISSVSVPLRAATRFADSGEWLFDEVAHVVRVQTTCTSNSDLTGIVHVNVTDGANQPLEEGVRWFAFASDSELPTTPAATLTNGNKGTYKAAIEQMLSTDFGITLQSYANESDFAPTGTYQTKAVAALNAHNKEGFVVTPGTSKYIYVVFWAEYGDLKDNPNGGILNRDGSGDGSGWSSSTYTANITIEARPYLGLYGSTGSDKTITVINSTTESKTVTLLAAGQSAVNYTVAANSGRQTITVHEGTQLRLVTGGGSFTVTSGTATLTGTNNTVCAVADMQSNLELTIQS